MNIKERLTNLENKMIYIERLIYTLISLGIINIGAQII